jgi:type III secretion protein U
VGGAALAGGALAGALQAQGLFTLEAVRVRLDRLHPARGLARLVSPQRLTAAAAQVLRLLVVAMVAWHLLRGEAQTLLRAPGLSPAAALRALAAGSVRMALSLAAVAAGLGALDLLLARRRHRKELMMSRDELRREQREDEGDPQRKAERRRLHRALAHASPLRRATCVVVNPTHVAVALDHPAGSDDAPVVIAKAMGRAAVRLRREARRAGVPIVRDVALARALFRLAEVGDEIPVELYEAAAAILVHLHAASGAPR